VLDTFGSNFLVLASLNTQSLNQFIENLSDAMALSTEITNIFIQMQENQRPQNAVHCDQAQEMRKRQTGDKAALYTPVSI
jgi:hypothetical protein